LKFIYQIGIFLYVYAVRLAALFNGKAKNWVAGRKDIWHQLQSLPLYSGTTVWVHCASLGEFEQGRPVMESLKKEFPDTRIILTFFSPSGYEPRKNYGTSDAVFYLPADLPGAAAKFYDAIKPDMGLIIKYEFWQGYLHEAQKRHIPLFLISGIFRKDMPFFKSYGGYFRKGLKAFEHFFIQDDKSLQLLQSIGLNNITVCGDTRLDRVLEAVEKRTEIPVIEKFKNNELLWICGSTWPVDDEMIISVAENITEKIKILLVPHDIHPEYIDKLISGHTSLSFTKFSTAPENDISKADIFIMDTMGMLTSAYAYADFVYVGGGFGKAVHNTMEPAAFGVPVLFGPKHQKFNEIAGLIDAKAGTCINNKMELQSVVSELISSPTKRKKAGSAARKHVEDHSGATPIIIDQIRPLFRFQ
jgi:3-deoxy-D-manno-octulosonic-acid transferase